jgi:hypothetical protein
MSTFRAAVVAAQRAAHGQPDRAAQLCAECPAVSAADCATEWKANETAHRPTNWATSVHADVAALAATFITAVYSVERITVDATHEAALQSAERIANHAALRTPHGTAFFTALCSTDAPAVCATVITTHDTAQRSAHSTPERTTDGLADKTAQRAA